MRNKCLEIIEFFKKENALNWAHTFTRLMNHYGNKPEKEMAKAIIQLYGGMTSFNDLVLATNPGDLKIRANERLDLLREELYSLALHHMES